MGGSSKKKSAATATPINTPPAYMTANTTVPAAMPGQLDALSSQLAAGFGQPQPDILALLNQSYQPMQMGSANASPQAPVSPAGDPDFLKAVEMLRTGYGRGENR